MHGGRVSFYRNGIRADLLSGSVVSINFFCENEQFSVNIGIFDD
jgi:hypothetical protein